MNLLLSRKNKNVNDIRIHIDQLRYERKWQEAIDLVKKSLQHEDKFLLNILKGEQESDEGNYDEARTFWEKAIDGSNDLYEANEARALLGKLEFIEKNKKKAFEILQGPLLEMFNEENFQKSCEFINTSYRLFLYLEGIKIIGLCKFELDDYPGSLATFGTVIDIGYKLCVQKQFISKQDQPLRDIIEDSLYSIPKLHFQLSDIKSTIESLREAINPKYSPSSSQRRRITKELAKVLLYHTQYTESRYPPITDSQASYVPTSAFEEGVFYALKYENELYLAQSKSLVVYNDIIFGCSLHKDYTTIIEAIERGLATNSDEPHLWVELALALLSDRRYERALVVVKQYLELTPNNASMLLLAAKICLNYTHDYSEAIKLCRKSIETCKKSQNRLLLARSWHYLGVCYHLSAKTILSVDQFKLHEKAVVAFTKAQNFGAKDYLFHFHFAMQYAEIREIAKSLHLVRTSTQINPNYAPAWVLYVLLLSSMKKYREASSLCKFALSKHPLNLQLLYIDVKLSLELEESNAALTSLQKLCHLVRDRFPDVDEHPTSQGRTFSNDDGQESLVSGSTILYSDSTSTTSPSDVLKNEDFTVHGLWVWLAEIFLTMKKYGDADECIREAKKLNPRSAELVYLNALLLEKQGTGCPRDEYLTAISIQSTHIKANIKLAEFYAENNQSDVAEDLLSSLAKKYPSNSLVWYSLGTLLQQKGNEVEAADCFVISLELSETDPIIPFSLIKHSIP